MTDLRRLDAAAAAAGLRAVPGARGFLGLDPVTANDPLLIQQLTDLGAEVFSDGETLLGYAPNPGQPRQAYIASTSAEPEPLRALMRFLHAYRRCTSFVAMIPAGSPAAVAFPGAGFGLTGTLREHRFAAGEYSDVYVYCATREVPCPA